MKHWWLTLVSALEKVKERLDFKKIYFMDFLSSFKGFEKATKQHSRNEKVEDCLKKEKVISIHLAFLTDVAGPFRQSLLLFQSGWPQIRIIYHSIENMLTKANEEIHAR